jgi:DNA-binding HxlR family transcriptional regulator
MARNPDQRPFKRRQGTCPACYSLDVFGDKWTLLILRDVLLGGKRYYREFLQSSEGIATNILADRLKHLVEQSLLTREDGPENKRQAVYLPTPKAWALMPVIDAMTRWALDFGPDTLRAPPSWRAPHDSGDRATAL